MNADLLKEVFAKHGTDKLEHGYAEHYAKHLPDKAKKILEIGVLKGSSIMAWHELYPEAHIYALDLFQENPIPFQADWVTWFKGSQVDARLLEEIRHCGPFDFVTEDASHNSRWTLMTFYGLVNSAPLYIVEDLGCGTEEFYRQGMEHEQTMMGQMWENNFPFEFSLYDDQIAFIKTNVYYR